MQRWKRSRRRSDGSRDAAIVAAGAYIGTQGRWPQGSACDGFDTAFGAGGRRVAGGMFEPRYAEWRQPAGAGRWRCGQGRRGAGVRRRRAPTARCLCAAPGRRLAGDRVFLWRQLGERIARRLWLCGAGAGGAGLCRGRAGLSAGAAGAISGVCRRWRGGDGVDGGQHRPVWRRCRADRRGGA